MKIRCYSDCKHTVIGYYDPSPIGVCLGSGSFVEVECSKEDELLKLGVDQIERSEDVGKHDGTFRRCPLYKNYTKHEMEKEEEDERRYLQAEAEYYKAEQESFDAYMATVAQEVNHE